MKKVTGENLYEQSAVLESAESGNVEASRKGDGEAQHRLAILEYVGENDANWSDYPINDTEFAAGLEWVRKDADAGNPVSQFQYGEILIWAGDIEKTMNTGLEYLKRSAGNGYALSAFELGILYADTNTDWGDVFSPNKNEAVKWFEKAADLGSSAAVDRLGELLYHDAFEAFERISVQLGSEDDVTLVKKVYELTRTAAEAGLPCSQMRLAAMYSDGMGVDQNDGEARSWLLRAEESGSGLAHECLEMILKRGMSTKTAIEACREKIS